MTRLYKLNKEDIRKGNIFFREASELFVKVIPVAEKIVEEKFEKVSKWKKWNNSRCLFENMLHYKVRLAFPEYNLGKDTECFGRALLLSKVGLIEGEHADKLGCWEALEVPVVYFDNCEEYLVDEITFHLYSIASGKG
tara:strand:- start:45 stop:458 length:414 start_codon:yes stop_codon:yes gene_type:complete